MRAILLLIIIAFTIQASGQTTTFEGVYQEENLYWRNTFIPDETCVDSVFVNDIKLNGSYSEPVFEIKFDTLGFICGDSITVKIFHKPQCAVSAMHPELSTPVPTLEVEEIQLSVNGELFWSTINETLRGNFIIERKSPSGTWIAIGIHPAKGSKCNMVQRYETKIAMLSGINEVRVVKHHLRKSPPSKSVKVTGNVTPATMEYDKKRRIVILSRPCNYQVHDEYGNIVLSGEGNMIDLDEVRKGEFRITFDNQMKWIELKRKRR